MSVKFTLNGASISFYRSNIVLNIHLKTDHRTFYLLHMLDKMWGFFYFSEPIREDELYYLHVFLECDDGTFGNDCVHQCSDHCLSDSPCNKQSGQCVGGCEPGYTSSDCSQGTMCCDVSVFTTLTKKLT